MKILIIDNYDSFTFNLYQHVGELMEERLEEFEVKVVRNDEVAVSQLLSENYDRIIISPGPGSPEDGKYFGVSREAILIAGKTIPVLGVCLGMQGIAFYFGGRIKKSSQPMHGKTSLVTHDNKGVFKNIPQKISVMRYHSLIADEYSLPESLLITARSIDTQEIMGLRHKKYPVEGIQFHPESFATEGGSQLLLNFLFRNINSL